MSYINDALQKVQKEAPSSYAPLDHLTHSPIDKPPARKAKILAAVLILAVIVAGGVGAWRYGKWFSAKPGKTITAKSSAAARPARNVQPSDAAVSSPVPVETAPSLSEAEPATSASGVPEEGMRKNRPETAATTGRRPENAPRHAAADAESLYAEALRRQREGHLLQAKDLYREVIKKDPRQVSALNNLGVIYLRLKRYRWAEIRLTDAVKIKPDYVEAHYNLACLYAQKNDTEKSLHHLKKALDLHSDARQWALKDRDLKNIAGLPEFQAVLQTRGE